MRWIVPSMPGDVPGGAPIGGRLIRAHSRWLSWALKRGVPVPRIPTRKVVEGGFAHLKASAAGREWAKKWWSETLNGRSLG